jgi:7-cyano-7-deazaguanine synthase in queuosine biosynthesis
MKLICGPSGFHLDHQAGDALPVILFGQAGGPGRGSAGEAALAEILRRKLDPAPRAWDLLSIALSIIAADVAGHRSESPDGWTRDFELDIAVAEPVFWNTVAEGLVRALAFLTTDRWVLRFHDGGVRPAPPKAPAKPAEDCVVLLSGGLDSLIGAIDLAKSKRPFAVSQIVRGDAEKQVDFAARIGGGLGHIQLNHNAEGSSVKEDSQRARSLIFIAFGVVIATALRSYGDGGQVPLYVCENGFIAMNPPLTGARLGSLSTRTAHPEFLARLQGVLDAAGLRVRIENPYRAMTKGEMLAGCTDQPLLAAEAARSTSCGRFQRFNYKHCGRCVPCQVRRAAFLTWGEKDSTSYVYEDLGKDDADYAGFDDVRAVRMAIAEVQADGLESWLGPALSSGLIADKAALKDMVRRGLEELAVLHRAYGVK